MTLTQLAEKWNCDKFYFHSYMPHYDVLFKDRKVKNLLEKWTPGIVLDGEATPDELARELRGASPVAGAFI